MVGQVLVQREPLRQAVCRVEVRAAWTQDGEVTWDRPTRRACPD